LPDDFYSNGPINGTTDAWGINFGFAVSDSIPTGGAATGLTFGAWLFPGDVLLSVEVTFSTEPLGGGTILGDQIVTFSQSSCAGNQYGFNVCTETGTLGSGFSQLAGGSWVTLQNAVVNTGDPVYWDENSGPSMAVESSVGTIPSEAFTVTGGGSGCVPEQQGNFKVIHDFSGGDDGASPGGLAIDNAGNLYGPAQSSSGAGMVYKMMQASANWVKGTLYNFLGGGNGSNPNGLIVGPKGNLYGAANGGIQNCSSGQFCGLIFGLKPSATACLTGSCMWTETALYRFTGPTDAAQATGLVSDQAGNFYGVSNSGGAQQQGAVFELSPSIGGYVESILYSFTGGADGGGPTDILVGNDGNLYGMAGTGGSDAGGLVFRLSPGGSDWTEAVLYNLPNNVNGTHPHSLLQDSAGNLFGIYEYTTCCGNYYGRVFELAL
jgi:uncharacterized repeat protein (TIGR03803 family)